MPPQKSTKGYSKSVDLPSGGAVTLGIDVNPLDLSEEDRRFVFALVDSMIGYEGGQQRTTVQLVGDRAEIEAQTRPQGRRPSPESTDQPQGDPDRNDS